MVLGKRLEKNRKMAHTVRNSDGTSPLRVSVSGDGTYQKRGDRGRGYTSKMGITVVFDPDTGLPLYYEIEFEVLSSIHPNEEQV